MSSQQVTLIVVAVVLIVVLLVLVIYFAVNGKRGKHIAQPTQISESPAVRSALQERNPVYRSHFNTMLPGSVSVSPGVDHVTTTVDLRKHLRRGDPIKVGAQIFIVDDSQYLDESGEARYVRAFTATEVPLGQEGSWVDEHGRTHTVNPQVAGKILSSGEGIPMYTTSWNHLGTHRWAGPRGGAVGHWKGSRWHFGGVGPNGFAPTWLGPGGKRMKQPSDAGEGCDGDFCVDGIVPQPESVDHVPETADSHNRLDVSGVAKEEGLPPPDFNRRFTGHLEKAVPTTIPFPAPKPQEEPDPLNELFNQPMDDYKAPPPDPNVGGMGSAVPHRPGFREQPASSGNDFEVSSPPEQPQKRMLTYESGKRVVIPMVDAGEGMTIDI